MILKVVLIVLLTACTNGYTQQIRIGFVDVVKDCQVNNNGSDVTLKLEQCFIEIQQESVIYFSPGVYTVSRPLPKLVGSHINIIADSFGVARIRFTGCGDLLTFTNGKKINFNSGIKNLWVNTTRSDCRTRAIVIEDASKFTVDNVYIKDFAVGIETFGREFLTIKDSKIESTNPIVISKNPNHATLDSDHTLITGLYSIIPTGKSYHVQVQNGVSLTSFTIERSATTKGAGILNWVSTINPGRVSYHVKIVDVRHEQNIGDKQINIDVVKPLYGLVIDNVRLEGPYVQFSTGIKLRNVFGVTIKDTSYMNNLKSTFIDMLGGDTLLYENNFNYPSSVINTGLKWVNGPFYSRNKQRMTGLQTNTIN